MILSFNAFCIEIKANADKVFDRDEHKPRKPAY